MGAQNTKEMKKKRGKPPKVDTVLDGRFWQIVWGDLYLNFEYKDYGDADLHPRVVIRAKSEIVRVNDMICSEGEKRKKAAENRRSG